MVEDQGWKHLLARVSCKDERFEGELLRFEEMQLQKLEPDAVSYNSIIHCCGEARGGTHVSL